MSWVGRWVEAEDAMSRNLRDFNHECWQMFDESAAFPWYPYSDVLRHR